MILLQLITNPSSVKLTANTMYWITRLPYIQGCLLVFSIILLIISLCTVVYLVLECDDCDEWREKLCVSALAFLSFVFFVSFFVSACAIPTPQELAAIYLVPKIANNQDIKQIPSNTAKLLNIKLQAWVKDNLVNADK